MMHVSMLLTILSISDCLGMCLHITDSGVSIGTSGWGVCVYSISGGQMVLTGCISKLGCFSDILCKAICAGVNCCEFIGNNEYFSVISLDLWSCLWCCLTVFNFATVNLSDFLAHLLFYQMSLCNHYLSIVHSCRCHRCWQHRHRCHQHLCTALLATGFKIETSYLV